MALSASLVYGQYKYFNYLSGGIDCSRQNMTSVIFKHLSCVDRVSETQFQAIEN